MGRFRDEITLTKEEALDILGMAVEAATIAEAHKLPELEFQLDGIRRIIEAKLIEEW